MSVPFLLTPAQMRRIRPHFPLSHGIPRVDDRRVLSGIIFVIQGGLRWRDAPPGYGPHKTLYNRTPRITELRGAAEGRWGSGMPACAAARRGSGEYRVVGFFLILPAPQAGAPFPSIQTRRRML